MRGEREERCIERIKKECNKWCCYGVSCEDMELLQNVMINVTPNPESSKFPDYIFDGGFIEHFQITSSKTNRKGSVHQKAYSDYRKRTDEEIRNIQSNTFYSPDAVQEYHWSFPQPDHSYDSLKKSLERVWKEHINSLERYKGEKEIGVFVIEYPEYALAMCENISDIKTGLRFDDLCEQHKFNEYRLSRDKKMLDFLYQYRNKITFVIYASYNRIEIIKIENIPEMKKLIPWQYVVCPLYVHNREFLYGISIPRNTQNDKEDTDE